VEQLRALVRTSPWTSLAGRAVLFSVGLVVLAWIGRVATAATLTPVAARAEATADAGIIAPDPATVPRAPATAIALPAPSPPPAQAPAPAAAAGARATPEDPVYLNHASAEQLRRLPGVGPKRAEAIVALRQRVGRFQRVEDLLRVKGVGRTTLRKWRPLVRLDAPPAPPAVDAGS
jgi:competence protein ComEA